MSRLLLLFFLCAFAAFIPLELSAADKPLVVTTIAPLESILTKLAGDKMEIHRLLPAGASPHTYAPKPHDMLKVEKALALVYVSNSFDGWAARFDVKKKYRVIEMLPEKLLLHLKSRHHHGHDTHKKRHDAEGKNKAGIDAHFWSDPMAVKAILPGLAVELCKLDKDNCVTYKVNAEKFSEKLNTLDAELQSKFKQYAGKKVLFAYPFFNYFLKRYKLEALEILVKVPGKDPTPKEIKAVLKSIARHDLKSVFTLQQLSRRPAELLAESGKLKVVTMDPLGGVEGRRNYIDLLRYNAELLLKGLK